MARAATTARYAAFGVMTLFAIFGSAFIVGETFTDPGGTTAVLLTVAWVVPMITLAVYAMWRPGPAATLMTAVTVVVAAFVVIDAVFAIVPRDEVGPVGSIAVFAVAVALAVLGVQRPSQAGWQLLLVGAANLGGGASGIAVAVPALVVGGMYLLAASWAAGSDHQSRPDRHRVGYESGSQESKRPFDQHRPTASEH